MNPVVQAIIRIIKEQRDIIGPIALDQARKVSGIQITSIDDIKISGNGKAVLEGLVKQYEKLFGQASVEVCKEAIEPLYDKLPVAEIPDILKN